jgi:CHAT domain-containing protein
VLIHTLSAKDTFYVFCTTPTSLIVQSQPLSRAALQSAVEDFRTALRDPARDPKPAAQKLHDLVIRPIQPALQAAKAKTLLFSLDGALRYVPMSALHDGKNWLAETYTVAMFTEAARGNLKNPAAMQPKIAALGVTKALAGFSALPAVAAELRGIVRAGDAGGGIVPGTVDLDNAFTRQAFAQRLRGGAPFIHIASHFQFNPAAQASSFLLMGDGNKMTMADMFYTSALQFTNVDLLALSACDTGSGLKQGDGREVESFGAMAQRHGARSVLAALWPVSDDSTAQLMQHFYQSYANEKRSKAEALRGAQLALLRGETPSGGGDAALQRGKVGGFTPSAGSAPAGTGSSSRYAHPHYWAPFIVMGNWL